METVIAAFILGCAVGMCAYRQGIIAVLGKKPFTKCDYCQFRTLLGKEPFPQKKEIEEVKSMSKSREESIQETPEKEY